MDLFIVIAIVVTSISLIIFYPSNWLKDCIAPTSKHHPIWLLFSRLLSLCQSPAPYQLSGKSVLITGAASGLGSEMAKILSQQGCHLTLWDINYQQLENLQAQYPPLASHLIVGVDVSNSSEITAALEQSNFDFDIVIVNAAVVNFNSIQDRRPDEIQYMFQVNMMQHFHLFSNMAPKWEKKFGNLQDRDVLKQNGPSDTNSRSLAQTNSNIDGPLFVMISSVAGLIALTNLTDYCASKFSLVGLSEGIRLELRHNKSPIKTLLVLPFLMNTPMFEGIQLSFPASLALKKLDSKVVAKKIVQAIQKRKEWLVVPWYFQLLPVLLALPVSVRNMLYSLIRENQYIEKMLLKRRILA